MKAYLQKKRWVVGRAVQGADAQGREDQAHLEHKKESAAELTKAVTDREFDIVVNASSLKAGDYPDNWLDSVRDTVKDRTWQRHEELARLHLKPSLGKLRLNRLDALQKRSHYWAKLLPCMLVV